MSLDRFPTPPSLREGYGLIVNRGACPGPVRHTSWSRPNVANPVTIVPTPDSRFAYDIDGLPLGQGSAVVVDTGTLVTNCHVLEQAKRVALRREGASHDARLSLWNPQRDVCQLRVDGLRS